MELEGAPRLFVGRNITISRNPLPKKNRKMGWLVSSLLVSASPWSAVVFERGGAMWLRVEPGVPIPQPIQTTNWGTCSLVSNYELFFFPFPWLCFRSRLNKRISNTPCRKNVRFMLGFVSTYQNPRKEKMDLGFFPLGLP